MGSGGFGTPLTLVTTIGAQGADTSIPSEKAVRSAYQLTHLELCLPRCRLWGRSGVCGQYPRSGRAHRKDQCSSDLAVLDFSNGPVHLLLVWLVEDAARIPASGANIIHHFLDVRSGKLRLDARGECPHQPRVRGTAARPDSPSYTELTAPIAITNNASGIRRSPPG